MAHQPWLESFLGIVSKGAWRACGETGRKAGRAKIRDGNGSLGLTAYVRMAATRSARGDDDEGHTARLWNAGTGETIMNLEGRSG